MNTKKVFFSYARTDAADFALQLAHDLKAKRFNVWIDQLDIPAGTEWDLEIQKALESCDTLLFIESEKSVASNNVLDEVYYALEEHKKVIPVIYHDSKTPFRLQRLQHVDFTKEYTTGLAHLLNELDRKTAGNHYLPGAEQAGTIPRRSLLEKYNWSITVLFLLAIAGAAALYFTNTGNQSTTTAITEKKEPSSTTQTAADTNPAVTNTTVAVIEEPANKKIEKKVVGQRKIKTKNITGPPNNPTALLTDDNLAEIFAGEWQLAAVHPKQASKRGYLRITDAGNSKVNIQSNFQFYFFKTNDTAQFIVFNGFASCTACVLKDGLKITEKDIAFGSNIYSILREDVPGESLKGDTVMSRGGNNTVSASVSLHLPDKNTVLIKVQKAVPTPVYNGLTIPSFEYAFRFRKNE